MVFFDSRNLNCKNPFGAVKSGEKTLFRFRVNEGIDVKSVYFILQRDGASEVYYNMRLADDRWFELELIPGEIGLYFYRFEVLRADGVVLFVGRGERGQAVVGDWLPRWKLTVYHPDFTVADKWKGGVMYQIFPDRFARISDQKPQGSAPGERHFHTDTADQPYDYTNPARPGGKDYFGGSIAGVRSRLPYLQELGVTVIYFNPVFESGENHRYSTADYMKIDPYFGTEEEFTALCEEAKQMGIEIILDGVFSHTGADSVYFNKENHYDSLGAYNSPDSPYYSWYQFDQYPDTYAGWWGFQNLPNVNETDPAYLDFITGDKGVLANWQQKGAGGWRLDVADELPDAFLEALRRRVKAEDPDSLIIGEVWEHAVEKHSYGSRRRFLLGEQCDSVMNYPWREAIIQLIKSGKVTAFAEAVQTLWEDYPRPALDSLMNILSTHDTVRILTVLGVGDLPRKMQAQFRLSPEQRADAERKLKLAALLQFTLPGIPCVYYGDEIAMEGFADPYCRAFFEWHKADNEMHAFYRELGKVRKEHREDFAGDFKLIGAEGRVLRFQRGKDIRIVVNFSDESLALKGDMILSTCEGSRLLPGCGAILRFADIPTKITD